jgi:hypothetical protein
MSTPLVQAKVQHWDSSGISVLCPSCNRTHGHHFNQQMYAGEWRRTSACTEPDLSKDYELRFPFDENTGDIGFYVDKNNGRYVTIGAQVRPRDNLLHATSSTAGNVVLWDKRRKWEEGKEEHILDNTDEGFRRLKEFFGGDEDETSSCLKVDYAISRLANGDVDWLKKYLNSSPEATLFLQGVDDMGNTALHLAARDPWPETVELLLRHEVNINTTNAQGRTPLMEAALWGRLDNVSLLLQNGADWEATDDEGYSATDCATPSQKNDDERCWIERSFNMYPRASYAYDTHRRNTERRQIVNTLKDREASKTASQYSSINDGGIEEFKFLTSIERCSISLVKEFPVNKTSKAIARLTFPGTRKDNFPPVDAMSGWKHGDGNEQVVIDGKDWTQNVMELANYLNYALPAGGNLDRGIRGHYYACHAEKQLIAYFVSKHVVLDKDQWCLREAIPPVMIKRAHIIVSREVCSDCKAFVAFVNRMLGLSLQVTGVDNPRSQEIH